MSLTSATKVETNKYELEIAVGAEDFKPALDRAFRKNIGKLNVPGFRKGKAPRAIVERMFGKEMLYEDAITELYPKQYEKALEEAKLEPVARAEIEVLSVDDDGFSFKAAFYVKPEVELGEYRGLKVTQHQRTVTDADIDAEIEKLRNRNARIITVEDGAATDGDELKIDFEGKLDGVPFPGGTGKDHALTIGSGQFIPGFEEKLIGHATGEEFTIDVTFPEDYHAEELKGKAAEFTVRINEIRHKELPQTDDEFAKDVSEFDTMDEFRADLRSKMQEFYDSQTKEETENKLLDQISEEMTAEIPRVMIDNKISDLVYNFESRLRQQGMKLDMYLKYTNTSIGEFRQSFEQSAIRQVRISLALEEITKREDFEVTPEDIEKQYEKMAKNYGLEIDKVKEILTEDSIVLDMKFGKAVDLVYDSARITQGGDEEAQAPAPEEASEETSAAE